MSHDDIVQPISSSHFSLSSSSFDHAHGSINPNFTYFSFPSPVLGRSPTLPSFRIPKYGYYNLEGDPSSPMSSPFEIISIGSGPRKNSVIRALIQSINYFVGIGVLTLPFALRTTGWFGLVLLVLFGLIMTSTAWLFGRSRKKIYLETFSDHIEFAFATKGRVIISLVFYASMLLGASVFVKLLSDTLSSITGLTTPLTLAATTIVFTVVTNVFTSTSSRLARVMNLLGTVSTVVLLVVLVTAEVLALLRYEVTHCSMHTHNRYAHIRAEPAVHGVWSYTAAERVYITDLIACLKTLGIFGYCYMGHEVFPAIFHNMRHPHCFSVVVTIAFTCMILCYGIIAALGYVAYGTHSAGNIVDNLPPDDGITWCVKVCLAMTVLARLAQCATPLCEGLLEWTRLVVYLASHTTYLAWLVRQPARPMPRLRLDASSHSVVPSQSTYGTYYSQQGTRRLHSQQKTQENNRFDLNAFNDRRKYFDTSYFDVEGEVKALEGDQSDDMVDETTHLLSGRKVLPTLEVRIPAPLAHRSRSNSLQRGVSHSHTPRGAGGSTPRRDLTWSDTLPIPPIRSPSCETLLASSTASTNATHLLNHGHAHGHGHACAGSTATMAAQAQANPLSALSTLLALSRTPSFHGAATVTVPAAIEEKQSESSSTESSPYTDDLFYDDNTDLPPSRHRLYSDFSDLLPASQLPSHPSTSTHSVAHPGGATRSEEEEEVSHCTACGEYFMTHALPVVVRCILPLLALGLACLFDSFAAMVIFTGGVCGGLVSIVIPTWAYFNIHHLELCAAEKSLLGVIIFFGGALATATVAVAAL